MRYPAISRRPSARAWAASVVGQTKIRAATSLPVPPAARNSSTAVVTSSAESQLRIVPSASRAASRSIPGRSAASSTGGVGAGTRSSRNRRTAKVSYCSSTTWPVKAALRKRTTSRLRWNGCSCGTAFQSLTMTGEDAPTPRVKRPGAASASAAACIASSAGPRVWTGTMAVPSCSWGAQTEARASGVKASAPAVSIDQRSVNPRSGSASTSRRWSASGIPSSGKVRPQRGGVSAVAVIPRSHHAPDRWGKSGAGRRLGPPPPGRRGRAGRRGGWSPGGGSGAPPAGSARRRRPG